jgi:hypothetical protein
VSAGFVRNDRSYVQHRRKPLGRVRSRKACLSGFARYPAPRFTFGLHFLCFNELATRMGPASIARTLGLATLF